MPPLMKQHDLKKEYRSNLNGFKRNMFTNNNKSIIVNPESNCP